MTKEKLLILLQGDWISIDEKITIKINEEKLTLSIEGTITILNANFFLNCIDENTEWQFKIHELGQEWSKGEIGIKDIIVNGGVLKSFAFHDVNQYFYGIINYPDKPPFPLYFHRKV